MCMDGSLSDLSRPHACFGTCWCERERTDAERLAERLTEDLSKLPLIEGLQRVAALKRESPRRIGPFVGPRPDGWAT